MLILMNDVTQTWSVCWSYTDEMAPVRREVTRSPASRAEKYLETLTALLTQPGLTRVTPQYR